MPWITNTLLAAWPLAVASAVQLSPAALERSATPASARSTLEVRNPASGALLASLPDCGAAETSAAIDRAESTLPDWSGRTPHERSLVLRRWFDLIQTHSEELAETMSLESGKPLAEARGEVAYGASFVGWYAEEAKRVNGAVLPSADRARRTDRKSVV